MVEVECCPLPVPELYILHIILFQPEIPSNTGNIIRPYADAGCSLYLIKPLNFELGDKRLCRVGLDCHEYASVRRYPDLQSRLEVLGQPCLFAFATRGSWAFHGVAYQRDDAFLFGPKNHGLLKGVCNALPADRRLHLPIREGCRGLNLSNTVAVTIYEAWRQFGLAMDWAGQQA